MTRQDASLFCRKELDRYGLKDWHVRLTTDDTNTYLGLCVYRDKTIFLNAHHIDMHTDVDIKDTIMHEIAHAKTPGHQHDKVWADMAISLGATPAACSHLSLPEYVIDAIRSGQKVDIEYETLKIPKYKITQLKDACPECGKQAKEKFTFETIDKDGNTVRLTTLECFHIIKKIIPRGTPFGEMVSNGWRDDIKQCKHEWDKNTCLVCGEYKLFNFQITGAQAAESGLSTQKGFGIFDDMGLGKTVQALAVIKYHKEYTPTLYIVKSAIKFQWFKEIIRWLGPDYLALVISTSKDFLFPGLKSYVISYDLLRRFPREKIQKLGIKLIVLDECQQIKNPDSSRTKEVRNLVGMPDVKVIPLSGTPWKNRGSEYFPVLNMIDPVKFYSHQNFIDTWVEYYYQGATRKQGGLKKIEKFREHTANILIRREYNEVMDEFPEINRMKLNVQLDELSQSTYDDEVSDFVAWYNEAVIDGMEESLSSIELLGRMSRMRHITGLAKIPATVGFVEEYIEDTDRKLVIFVHHKDVAELLYDEIVKLCEGKDIDVLKLTAGSDEDKFEAQEKFNNSHRAFLIASTLASGEGLNLQTCADSVLHERQWNPQNEDQATPGRFRRIGQKSKVINNTTVEADGTIDQHVGDIVETKRKNFHKSMNKSEVPVYSESEFAKDLAARIASKHKSKSGVKTPLTKSLQF
jgi:hypothetical protein